jgi:hypothetical protein
MKRLLIGIALLTGFATAYAADPFASSTTPAPGAAPGAPSTPGTPGAAPMTGGPQNPQNRQGGVPAPPGAAHSAQGLPMGMPNIPGLTSPAELKEDVPSRNLGTINGFRIFKGTDGTYLFNRVKDVPFKRELTLAATSQKAASEAASPAQPRPNLPSTVGRPNPTNK